MSSPSTSPDTGELPDLDSGSTFTLKGNMGTTGLLFAVLAFTAPLGVVFGFVSFNISFGVAVPIAFLLVTGFIALFAVGFTLMTRRIFRPGAFCTYIAEGLGRPGRADRSWRCQRVGSTSPPAWYSREPQPTTW